MGTIANVPSDWYLSGFPLETTKMPWADRTEAEVNRAVEMLRPHGGERILDLACGIGRHALELGRRGFEVVGVELSEDLLTVAERADDSRSSNVSFIQADLRELDFEDEFDLVLSLNDGAVGYFETDAENLRTFEVVARALRAGGSHLVQLPNILHAERNLPRKSWIVGEATLELSDHRWNADDRYIEGSTVPIPFGEVFESYKEIPFRQRLYSVEELAAIYESVGMRLASTFSGGARPRKPKPNQFEVFAKAEKG